MGDFCELDFRRGNDGRALAFPALARTGNFGRPPLVVRANGGLDDEADVLWEVEPEVSSPLPPDRRRCSARRSRGVEEKRKSSKDGPVPGPAIGLESRFCLVPVMGDNEEDLFRTCLGEGKSCTMSVVRLHKQTITWDPQTHLRERAPGLRV